MARNSIAPGGYIGGEPPRRPMFNQLSGVWKLDDVLERQKNNSWANALGVEDVFSTWLYTGNGSTQTITNGIDLSGNGGLVWIKQRNSGSSHELVDTARGVGKGLDTRTDGAQTSLTDLTSFTSSGFSLGYNTGNANFNTGTFASWTFRKAAKFFDVVTYTGNGQSNNTINHNLGSAPGAIIIKTTSQSGDWVTLVRKDATNYAAAYLNLTNSANNVPLTEATSTTVNVGRLTSIYGYNTNTNGVTYVAYLFAHDAGGFGDSGNDSVVSCGSFTASATVTLGWEPQWLLIKNSGGVADWNIVDNMRGWPVTGNAIRLQPNTTNAEATLSTAKITPTGFTYNVGDSNTYVYIAIRRGPMKAPTDATKVFNAITATASTGASRTVGFSADTYLARWPGTISGGFWQDRLRGFEDTSGTTTGKPAFDWPNGTNAETTGGWPASYQVWNTTAKDGGQYSGANTLWYYFRRAPGFFDVVAYTGTGANRTVSHNLGVAPELMIVKRRDTTGLWAVYSSALGATDYLLLHTTAAKDTVSLVWNNVSPTSSAFTVGTSSSTNASAGTYVAYLFASCPGVSKVGSYTGTGTTLSVDCGFANGARFVLIKRTDSTGDWYVWDTARGIVSGNDPSLLLNSTAAEVTNTDYIDPYSFGFEISSTAPAAINANGGSYIFLAIA